MDSEIHSHWHAKYEIDLINVWNPNVCAEITQSRIFRKMNGHPRSHGDILNKLHWKRDQSHYQVTVWVVLGNTCLLTNSLQRNVWKFFARMSYPNLLKQEMSLCSGSTKLDHIFKHYHKIRNIIVTWKQFHYDLWVRYLRSPQLVVGAISTYCTICKGCILCLETPGIFLWRTFIDKAEHLIAVPTVILGLFFE